MGVGRAACCVNNVLGKGPDGCARSEHGCLHHFQPCRNTALLCLPPHKAALFRELRTICECAASHSAPSRKRRTRQSACAFRSQAAKIAATPSEPPSWL